MALLDTSVMLKMMGLPNLPPAQAQRYDLLRQDAEAACKAYCKWELEAASVTEYYCGSGLQYLPLNRPFVSAVASVYLDPAGAWGQAPNAFPAGTLLTAGQDYALALDDASVGKSGQVVRLAGTTGMFLSDYFNARGPLSMYRMGPTWPYGQGNVKITYTYGWATGAAPKDILLAVTTAVAIAARSSQLGYPIQSEGIGARNYSLNISTPPEYLTCRQLLNRYRDTSV